MNKTRIITAMALGMTLAPQALTARDLTITVTNNEDVQRQEVVEIDAAKVSASLELSDSDKLTVKNALGQQVAYQLTHDGKLLIDVAVRPKGSATFTVSKGTPAPMKHFVKGKQYPERVDDIAWENDRTAYRIYGPALQASGERAFGVDVWLKNTPDLEVDKRYATELSNHPAIQKLREEGKDDEALAMEQATTYTMTMATASTATRWARRWDAEPPRSLTPTANSSSPIATSRSRYSTTARCASRCTSHTIPP